MAPGNSPAGSRPQGAALLDEMSATSTALGGRLAERESPSANKQWRVWLLLGGRGSGKTRAGAEWVREIARGEDPGPRSAAGATLSRLAAGSPQGSRKAQSKKAAAVHRAPRVANRGR